MRVYTGSCLCGGIRLRIASELAPIEVCHCTQCRKAQGGPFASNIPVDVAALELLDPERLLKSYASSPGKERCFCGRCGSPVFSRRASLPQVVRLRAGLLDQALPVRAARHAYTASKCNWWPIEDDLPQYPAGAGAAEAAGDPRAGERPGRS